MVEQTKNGNKTFNRDIGSYSLHHVNDPILRRSPPRSEISSLVIKASEASARTKMAKAKVASTFLNLTNQFEITVILKLLINLFKICLKFKTS